MKFPDALPPHESGINIVAEGSRFEGTLAFDQIARIHGVIIGQVRGTSGSTLIFTETASVEGDVSGDLVLVDGFIRGNIEAKTKVVISATGRVIGDIRTGSLQLDYGAYFEGRCAMDSPSSDSKVT